MRERKDLASLLVELRPEVIDGEFVFISRPGATWGDASELGAVAGIHEKEGLTLLVDRARVPSDEPHVSSPFRMISMRVASPLDAVGLTEAIAGALAQQGISANVIAGFHHDHVLVPAAEVDRAMQALHQLMQSF